MIIFLLLVSVAFIILFTVKWKIHPFLALLVAALFYALAANMPFEMILTSIEEGFGGTLGKIGLVILLGVIIGAFLENSGGAYKMAEVVLKIIGRKRIHAAMAIIGYIVSIPVFSDSGFIILNPLNKSLSKKAGLSIAGTSVALALGLLLTHVMVPPTPGPIAAAAILEADIGLVMLIGISVSALSLIIAIIYSKRIAGKTYIDPNPELSEEQITAKMIEAPSAFKSFLPILIPILLIVGKSLSTFLLDDTYADTSWFKFIGFIGSPIIALIIGVLLSFLLPKKIRRSVII